MKYIKFFRADCEPCADLSRKMQEANVAADLEIDVQDDPQDYRGLYNVKVVPTLIKVADSGQELARADGRGFQMDILIGQMEKLE